MIETSAREQTPEGVMLSCRRLWKVYGPDPKSVLNSSVEQDMSAEQCDALVHSIREAGHIPAACNVSFDVTAGEIFVIMGLSGSGKSTIVRCLSRLVEPTSGEVILDGQDLMKIPERELIELRRHKMGMVFQNFGLLPHQCVLDNVAFPLKVQGIKRAEREKRAQEMIELVGLEGRERSFPRELSGGQQQRVGIARSLAVEPMVWFLDEPFSAIDPLIRRQMQDEFLRLQRVLHKTIVFITHDFLEALRVADRIAIMNEGQIVQLGTPAEVVMQPASDYVAEFTKDAPRAQVLTVADIAEPLSEAAENASPIPGTTSLDHVVRRIAQAERPIAVTDEAGKIIGQVTHQVVLQAMASADEAE